jgi:hypothetical protein
LFQAPFDGFFDQLGYLTIRSCATGNYLQADQGDVGSLDGDYLWAGHIARKKGSQPIEALVDLLERQVHTGAVPELQHTGAHVVGRSGFHAFQVAQAEKGFAQGRTYLLLHAAGRRVRVMRPQEDAGRFQCRKQGNRQ